MNEKIYYFILQCVSRNIRGDALNLKGISQIVLSWLKLYLSCISQIVLGCLKLNLALLLDQLRLA